MRRYFADKTCINLIRLVLLLVTALLDALAYYFIPVAPYLSALPVVLWVVIVTVTVAGLFAAMVYLPLYFRHTCYYVSPEQVVSTAAASLCGHRPCAAVRSSIPPPFPHPFPRSPG